MVVAALTASAQAASAQDASFIPGGWVEESAVDGDLNGDRQPDRVIIIRQNDPARRIKNDSLGDPELDTNPRRLLVLVRSPAGLTRAAENDTILPPKGDLDSRCLADPLEEGGIAVRGGMLRINLTNWLSCGSYGITKSSYVLRLERGQLRLIGYDRLDFSRASGEGEKLSANFLAGRYSKTTGLVVVGDQPEHSKTVWHRFSSSPIYADKVRFGECLEIERLSKFC